MGLWSDFWPVVSDREKIRAFISQFGMAAPLVFMGLQIFQVIFAPIPGEATGLIGGYLFGAFWGFIYSSLGLTIGSYLSFSIGRMLGQRYVRKMIPKPYLERMDFLMRHQGVLVIIILFILPGFPKDYLCLFLGISTLPMRAFLLIAALGRMPGTLLLSLQGESLFEGDYTVLALLLFACFLFVYLVYRHRDALYRWIEKQNNRA